MSSAQPTFQGAADEQKVAEMVFDLMRMQGRAFAEDAPIRQSLRNFSTYFLEHGLRPSQEEVSALLEAAIKANSHIFYRQETVDDVFLVTSRKGLAVRPSQAPPIRYIPPAAAVAPALAAPRQDATAPTSRPTPKPTLLKRETPIVVEAKPTRREIRREPKPAPVVKRPQIVTTEGEAIYMDRPAEEILEAHDAYFQSLLADRLATDARFVSFGVEWLLADMLVSFTKNDLRRVRQAIEDGGDVLPDTTFLTDLFGKSQEDEDYERTRFSLNYALARERRDFEFRGTNEERLWGILGMASAHVSRSPLRPSEIGQDFKFLEDEPARTGEGAGRWIHALTFYEIENGLLPYSSTAKLVLPRPLLKDQRVAVLEFRAPQLNLATIGELHYPSGNRGGWVDGLEDILDSFIPGTRMVLEGTERDNVFLISYRRDETVELETIRYDEKKGRFVFVPFTADHQLDDTMLITKTRFKNLANARRLEENARRKGDNVIGFAFTRVGTKSVEEEEKTVYRANVTDLLPVVNLEKPFSRASLLRFMTTHPHYRKDETEEGYYFYRPEE